MNINLNKYFSSQVKSLETNLHYLKHNFFSFFEVKI